MSSRNVTDRNVPAVNPLVIMYNKRTSCDCVFFKIFQNFNYHVKDASNEQRLEIYKKGMKMQGAQDALDHYDFAHYVIIKSNAKDEIQLMAVKSGFNPTKTDAFECVYPKWDSDLEAFEDISEVASETASVTSGTQRPYATVAKFNGNDNREFPALTGNTSVLRAQSPSAMTVTTTQTVEKATVSEDLSKEFISLLDKFNHLSDMDFFLTCTKAALSAKEEHFETFGQLQTAFWNAKNGFFERKPDVPEPPANILPVTPSVPETTSVTDAPNNVE